MIAPRTLAALGLVLALGGCGQNQMANHGRSKPYERAEARHPPAGTVAREDHIGPRAPKPKTTLALLTRGQTLFDGICAPCHSRLGDGDGIVVRRGFPNPPTFHQDRLRDRSGHIVLRRDHQRLRHHVRLCQPRGAAPTAGR